ncbi:hypothetical protein COO60DRAFT_1525141, partial [Scenedesmus sp. NREL 46B-D3]
MAGACRAAVAVCAASLPRTAQQQQGAAQARHINSPQLGLGCAGQASFDQAADRAVGSVRQVGQRRKQHSGHGAPAHGTSALLLHGTRSLQRCQAWGGGQLTTGGRMRMCTCTGGSCSTCSRLTLYSKPCTCTEPVRHRGPRSTLDVACGAQGVMSG